MAMKLLLVLSLIVLHVSALSIKDKLRQLQEDFPFLDAWKGENKEVFAEEEGDHMKHYIRMLFRNWNFQGTPMQDVIQSGELPDLTELSETFSLVNILDRLENDQGLRAEIMDLVEEKAKRRDEEQYAETSYDQVDGYEGCKRDYSSLVDPITNRLLNIVLPPIAQLPVKPLERWGLAMIDALTKIPEGITDGKLHWVGAYEKCNGIHAHYNYTEPRVIGPDLIEEREFNAQYCRLDFNPVNPLLRNGSGIDYLRLQLGICVPDTCSRENISYYIMEENRLLSILLGTVLGLKLDLVYCGQETDYETDTAMQATVGIILSLVIIVTLATIYDSFFRFTIMKRYVDGLAKKGQMAIQRSISQISTGAMQGMEPSSPPIQFEPGSPSSDPPVFFAAGPSEPPAGGLQRQTSSSSIGSYHHVHPDDYRRYSIKSGATPGSSNGNNNNDTAIKARSSHPTLTSQMSTQSQLSTKALMPDVAEVQTQVENPSVFDRLEVLFVGFSAYSNLSRVFNASEGKENELPSLNGVRFLSWMYALFGHVWLFGPVYNECWTTGNLNRAIRDLPRQLSFQPIINFHFSSDAFFVISGCLVSYYWLKKVHETGGISIRFMIRYYFYRYWSLMPALMMVLMTYTATYRYLGSGPLFPPNVRDADNCRTEWWTDLLLIHNLVNPDHMCLTWTWYTGILWQLYMLTPLFLIPFIFKRWLGYLSLAAQYIIHLGATAGVSANLYDDEEAGIVHWFREYFLTPWCRAGPYCVGLVLGCIIHSNKKIKLKINPGLVAVGWVVAMVLICSAEYGTYSIFKEGGQRWDKPTRVMYDTFSSTAFGLGVAWIMFACEMGYGGFISHILSWRVFIPLGRIVYPSYLLHAMMIFTFVYGQYTLLYLNTFNVVYWFFGHIWVVHAAGIFFVGLLFHWPLSEGVIRMWRVENKLDCVKAGRHPPIPETAYDVTAAAHKQYAKSVGIGEYTHHLYDNLRHRLSPSRPYEHGNTEF